MSEDSAYWSEDQLGYGNPKGAREGDDNYRHYNPYSGYEPSSRDERAGEEGWADKDKESNWGPPPSPDHLSDPGFTEHEVDDWQDPDHGREDRVGAILRQSEQWPVRTAANRSEASHTEHLGWGDAPPPKKKNHSPKPVTPTGGDVHRVKGLYGEDEDHPYDVYATQSEHGNGWDVIRPVGQ